MQRLMDIRDVMGEKNDRNNLRDFALVLFRHLALQDIDTERNHVHDVPFTSPRTTVAISLRRHYRDVRVVEPVVRRRGRIGIMCWLVRAPEITQLSVNAAMGGIMK